MSSYDPPNPPNPQDPYGQQGAGQPGYGAPQYGAPQYGAPQYGAPQYGGQPGGPVPAGLLERFLARLIDGVLMGIVSFIIGMVFGGNVVATDGTDGQSYAAAAAATLLGVIVNLAYFGFLESSRGATLGKQLLKLRVVAPEGGNPTLATAVKRNIFLAFGLAGLVPFLGIIGSLATLVAVIVIAVQINGDKAQRQGWHDKFAGGTHVVKVG
ncbi:RDD family protein [Nocardioides kribbensis]|uniref:RDD family protein n=1 Tax=Nocardioides kribbensis TaxID=305517 RepID=UPI00187ADED8|nr:RDD family protein [Nocardioides kribbensis]